MKLWWTEPLEIAIALNQKFPEIDPQQVRFTDLYRWVIELPEFEDDPKRCNERILEAIQAAWMEEAT